MSCSDLRLSMKANARSQKSTFLSPPCCSTFVFKSILFAAVTRLLAACESDTDKLKRSFENRVKRLESEMLVAAKTYGEARLLKPLADRFGEQNCRSLVVSLDRAPLSLRRQPNDLLLPYRAELAEPLQSCPADTRFTFARIGCSLTKRGSGRRWWMVIFCFRMSALRSNWMQRTEQLSAHPPNEMHGR